MKKYCILFVILISLLAFAGCGDDHGHDHGDLPFEWSGEFTFELGVYNLEFMESGDPSCDIAFVLNEGDMEDIAHHAHHILEEEDITEIQPGGDFIALPDYGYTLVLNPDQTTITFEITEAGEYVVFLEHFPSEFDLKVLDSSGNELTAKNPVEYEDDH
ncbi:hypothetical protein [Candidatus Contubernalis alkaliaceticus]|uniref:hypothetical protein n=1 Tax=Candidatus Contubernalis alkaliaceticus TaxID=338645 RepID=UPI001F4C0A9F|nr:hypothetical protein [Candidatus Contubernalis alkalaceticus]UNC93112.1 hypothetical protein HUE98_14060 [Candidatus Contubernalis alkalaceticus]